jgi:hypothetical protein
MQTLNIAESTPERSESRVKALLWPSVQNATDVDYLSTQGFWICTLIALFSLIVGVLAGNPYSSVLVFFYYILGGMGVREGSITASILVFSLYLIDVVSGISVVRIIFSAILLSNVRAIWLAAHWQPGTEEAEAPPRLNDTLSDKYSDQLPRWLWPKIRYIYFVFAFILLIVATAGVIIIFVRAGQLRR